MQGPDGIQAIGQLDDSSQFAFGLAATLQLDPSNEWAPDRKKSPGTSGPLSQMGMKAANDASGSHDGDRPVQEPGREVGDAANRVTRRMTVTAGRRERPAVTTSTLETVLTDSTTRSSVQ